MIQLSRRALVVIGIVLCFIAVIVITTIVILNSKDKADKQSTTEDSATASYNLVSGNVPFHITNIADYTNIDSSTEYSIESTLYFKLKANTNSASAGVIRQGSYVTNTNDTITSTSFIVDIPSAKQSYVVNIGTDSSTSENSINIICPTKDQLMYPAFSCEDNQG